MVRRQQSEKAEALLREAPGAALAKIRKQIEKGEELLEAAEAASGDEGVERAIRSWNDYNEELLRVLFTTDEYKISYRWAVVNAAVIVGLEPPGARRRRLIDSLGDRLGNLRSLADRIEIIPTAPGVVPADEPSNEIPWGALQANVVAVARKRFEDGHYADAVEAALKALNNEVKAMVRSRGGPELDGATLMHTAFSPKKPIIVLADLTNQTGRDQQQGYMELFAGAMSAIRNPKAHDNLTLDPQRALHLLFLASMLWSTLDQRP